jgi:hypothetical protein
MEELFMKKLMMGITFPLMVIIMMNGNICFAQELKAGEKLPEPSPARKIERMKSNMDFMLGAHIQYARENNMTAAEAGEFMGLLMAKTWPRKVTPQNYVLSMNHNWQSYGTAIEVVEVKGNYIKTRRKSIDHIRNFNYLNDLFAFNVAAEFDELLNSSQIAIASEIGLKCEISREGDYFISKISGEGSANLKAGEALPVPGDDAKLETLRGNYIGIIITNLKLAEKNSLSIEDITTLNGHLAASTWPAAVTPAYYVRAMNLNFQAFDAWTEIVDVGDNYVKGRRNRIFSGENYKWAKDTFGYSSADFEKITGISNKVMADAMGLDYEEYRDGENIVFTVSKAHITEITE